MEKIANESILITGANAGLGKETARQLQALKKRNEKKVQFLFCRNQARAEAAKKDLEAKTGKRVFEIIIGDVTDANSVRRAVEEIKEPIDAVILNAGGVVGKTAAQITASGMNELSATNILGNVILVDELIQRDMLRKAVLAVSAEAVPGVKMLGVNQSAMRTSSVEEFAAVLDGSYFGNKKFDALQAYAYVKYAETMWTLSMARKYPQLKFIVVSPGNTSGTQAPNALPLPMRIMLKYVMMPIVFPLMGEMVQYAGSRCQTASSMASRMSGIKAAFFMPVRRVNYRGRWWTRAPFSLT